MTNIKFGITLSNDPLADKRFDFQFANPPSGYEWNKDHDADTTRKPMQYNPSVRQRFGQRGIKAETLPPLLPSSFSQFIFQNGQILSSTQIRVGLWFETIKNALDPANDTRFFIGETEISLVA
jgi:hypothetical protein